MQFVDKVSTIFAHLQGGSTVDIQKCPHKRRFAVASPSAIAIFNLDQTEPTIFGKYVIPKELIQKSGFITRLCWMNEKQLLTLTNNGYLHLFSLERKNNMNMIKPVSIIKSKSQRYTTVACHKGKIIIGDENGTLTVLSSTFSVINEQTVSTYPIKQIEVSNSRIVVLVADSTAMYITTASIDSTFEIHEIEGSGFSMIASDRSNGMCALYSRKGTLLITDFDGYSSEVTGVPYSTALAFSADGSLLIIASKNQLGLWNSRYRRLSFVMRSECVNVNAIAISTSSVFASADDGILVYPLLATTHSTVPILRGSSKIVEYKATDRSFVSVDYSIPEFGNIDYAAADGYDRFIAVVTSTRIGLISRRTMGLVIPSQPTLQTRAIEWCGPRLAVVNFNQKDDKFELILFDISSNGAGGELSLTAAKTIPLAKPLALGSDSTDLFVVSMPDAVLVIDKNMEMKSHRVECSLVVVKPHAESRTLIGINKNSQLVALSLETGEYKVIRETVSDFYISAPHSLLFCVDGVNMLVSELARIRFKSFSSREVYPIGVEPSAFSLLTLDDLDIQPLSYLEKMILSRLGDTDKVIKLLEKTDALNSVFLQNLAVMAANDGVADKLIRVFGKLQEDLCDEVIANALRRLEKKERAQYYPFIGDPLKFFCRLLACSATEESEICVFSCDGEGCRNVGLAVLLLPILLEEFGPSVAFPATCLCLTLHHETLDVLYSYARFLEPLLSRAEAVDSEKVSCVGMELQVEVYASLKENLEDAVTFCINEFIEQMQLSKALQMSLIFKVPMHSVLARMTSHNMSLQDIVKRSDVRDSDVIDLARVFERSKWYLWQLAMLIRGKQMDDARILVHSNSSLQEAVKETPWQTLT